MGRRSSYYSGPTRSLYSIAKPRLFGPIYLRPFVSPLGDRRAFYPDSFRPADYRGLRLNRSIVARPHVVKSGSRSVLAPDSFGFRNPRMVMICARRKQRKEVLFALNRAGSGAGRSRKHRNEFSEVSC